MRQLIFIESIIFVRQRHKIYKIQRLYLFKRWIGMKSAKVSINLNVAKFIVCKSLHSIAEGCLKIYHNEA